jgi:hypothetical protein
MTKILKDHLLEATRGAVEALRQPAPNPMKSVFQMSAVYGALARVLNLEYSPEISFAHFVIQHATQLVGTQVSKVIAGAEKAIELRLDIFYSLADALEGFADRIRNGQSFHAELQRIAEVAYAVTGNGHYLYLNGKIVLSDMPEPSLISLAELGPLQIQDAADE